MACTNKIEYHEIWIWPDLTVRQDHEPFKAFTWRGAEKDGIARAWKEAPQFGVKPFLVTARPVTDIDCEVTS